MKNPNPEKQGFFFKVLSSTWAGILEQYTCAVCGSPAIAKTFGVLACTNSPEDCPQGGTLYAIPVVVLEPYNPAKHGRG